MDIVAYLKKEKVKFERMSHPEAFTSQEVAAAQHVPGRALAKAVVVKADEKYALAVLPAIYKVNFKALAKVLGTKKATLAAEEEMQKLFPDVEIGAEPPFGNLYNVETIVEQHLAEEPEIVFQAGTHKDTIKLKYADYAKLTSPKVAQFGDHI